MNSTNKEIKKKKKKNNDDSIFFWISVGSLVLIALGIFFYNMKSSPTVVKAKLLDLSSSDSESSTGSESD